MSNSPEKPASPNKAPPQKLPKKCWREEYIRILEWLEYPSPLRRDCPVSEEDDTPQSMLFQELLRELEEAGLIHVDRIRNSWIIGRNITYFGRLELERLKSLRPSGRMWKGLKGIAVFALGAGFNMVLSVLKEHLTNLCS